MDGHESHVMQDGSEHEAGQCPDDCHITDRIIQLLADLESGAIVAVRML